VQKYYSQLSQAADLSKNKACPNGHASLDDDQDILNLNEEADNHGDLPSRFSELEQKHFPLFVTYD